MPRDTDHARPALGRSSAVDAMRMSTGTRTGSTRGSEPSLDELDALLASSPTVALSLVELRELAHNIAAAETLWRPATKHDPEIRGAVRLLATETYEVWVQSWMPGQRVELHDHRPSAGVIVVVEGELVEIRLVDGHYEERTLGAGDRSDVPSGQAHDLVNRSDGPTTSIHVYSPILRVVGLWDIDRHERVAESLVPFEPPVLPAGDGATLALSLGGPKDQPASVEDGTGADPSTVDAASAADAARAADSDPGQSTRSDFAGFRRRAVVLDEIRRSGSIEAVELAARFAVTATEIRRDLDVLADQGLVDRSGSGPTIPPGSQLPSWASARLDADEDAGVGSAGTTSWRKVGRTVTESVARVAANIVSPGSAVALSSGSISAALARQLRTVPLLTVVTNSIDIADILHRTGRTDQTVILTGGTRTARDTLVGPAAIQATKSLRVDLAFVEPDGIDAIAGLTVTHQDDAAVARALVASGRRAIALATTHAIGHVALGRIDHLCAVDALVVDDWFNQPSFALVECEIGEVLLP